MADMEDELETVLAGARRDRSTPQELLDRVRADAEALQPAAPERYRAQLLGVLGGWRGLTGLAAASLAGVWLGAAPPASLPDPAALLFDGPDDFTVIGGDDLALILAEEG